MKIKLEKDLENSLRDHPELIDDSLRGIRPGLQALGDELPRLMQQDSMPNGRRADLVFVEPSRITVVEIKKVPLKISRKKNREDPVDQVCDYLRQCKIKYPHRREYRGFIVATGVLDTVALKHKLAVTPEPIVPLTFGKDIPPAIRICEKCLRAVRYDSHHCRCGASFR